MDNSGQHSNAAPPLTVPNTKLYYNSEYEWIAVYDYAWQQTYIANHQQRTPTNQTEPNLTIPETPEN